MLLHHISQLWTGREYYSLEKCDVEVHDDKNEIAGTIVGHYSQIIYKVHYVINTDVGWNVTEAQIICELGGKKHQYHLKRDGHGEWTDSTQSRPEFAGCTDVDIALTPLTNTLPIRRLKMQAGRSEEIKVIYFDLLTDRVKPVKQRYLCISPTQYKYENIPNDFEAVIDVDEHGLVVDYPRLFLRTAVNP